MTKISYTIMAKEEPHEFGRIVQQIMRGKLPQDELVVVFDVPHEWICECLIRYLGLAYPDTVRCITRPWDFKTDDQRNAQIANCTGDWVFYVDTDEQLKPLHLGAPIHHFLDSCEMQGIDLVWLPRINIVNPLPEGWKINDKGWVDDFPNYLPRIHRRLPAIHWVGYLHEHLEGAIREVKVPPQEEFSILHEKTLERQEMAGALYRKADEVAKERGWVR